MKIKKIFAFVAIILMLALTVLPAFAIDDTSIPTEQTEETETIKEDVSSKTFAAAIVVGATASLAAIAMGWAISSASKSIARQPEAAGNIRTNVMLGLVFIETAIIYALIVAILIIFVL